MDKYSVDKRIGVGTYGSAYLISSKAKAEDQYVLKKVKVQQEGEKERLQAESEVKVLRQLSHPLVLGSPEVMSSQPYDFKSDMWSLGCVLYEMMSLQHAFDASDMSSLVLKIMRGEHLPVPTAYSADLRDLVKQLLSRAPRGRPTPEMILRMPLLKGTAGPAHAGDDPAHAAAAGLVDRRDEADVSPLAVSHACRDALRNTPTEG
ncbi:MAG: hypothetical protein WDW36_007491 [Sanguina aurantia]